MIMNLSGYDNQGQQISEFYTVLTDLNFEKKLKVFDPNLVLLFNQANKRWTIMSPPNPGEDVWRIILVFEDRQGNPMPADWNWAEKKLYVMREANSAQRDMGADGWMRSKRDEAKELERLRMSKVSRNNMDRTKDNFLDYRKMIAELQNEPVSDVTAGYPKITHTKEATNV